MKSGSRAAVTSAWSTVVAVSPPSFTSTPLWAITPLRSRSTSDFVSGDDGPSLGVIATVAVSLASLYRSGFLLKRSSPEQLIAAIHTVADGEALLSPSVTRRLIERVAAHPILSRELDPRLAELTTREREVLELVAQGLSNAEIAEALTLERTTIKTHVQRILTKLGARNRVEVVIVAYEWGLITPGRTPHAAP